MESTVLFERRRPLPIDDGCKDAPPPSPPPLAGGGVKAPKRRWWPPDRWDPLLARHGVPLSRTRKADLEPGLRIWAYDLPRAADARSGAPKRWFAADAATFASIYSELKPDERHAYEVFDASRGCHAYFDLDGGHGDGTIPCADVARCIVEEAAGVLRDLIASRAPAHIADSVVIEVLTVESAHGSGKFSQHVLLQATRRGERCGTPCCLLAGLATAHAVAARAVARCEQRGIPKDELSLVDFAVYRAGGCLRLLGSSKLSGDARAPLSLAVAHSTPGFAALEPRELLLASLVQPAGGGGDAFTLTIESAAPPRAPRLSSMVATTDPSSTPAGGPSDDTSRAATAVPHERWRHLTARPLLETPRLVPRELSAPRRSGRGAPPAPLDRLGRWGAAQLRRLGCEPRGGGIVAAGPSAVIASWRLSVLEGERVLRLVAWAGGRCACRGRAHRSRPIVLAVDLCSGDAFQQCLDWDCREQRGGGYVAASALVGVATAGSGLPSRSVLEDYLK